MSKEKIQTEKSILLGKFTGKQMGIVGGIVVILLALIAGIVIYNTPENRLSRQLDLGQKYLEEQNYEQAIVEFDKAIEIDPMSVEAYLGLAEAYIGMGDVEAALDVLKKGYELTEDERLQAKIRELKAEIEKNNEEEIYQEEDVSQEDTPSVIQLPFELTDFNCMGYDLFEDHFEEVCRAFPPIGEVTTWEWEEMSVKTWDWECEYGSISVRIDDASKKFRLWDDDMYTVQYDTNFIGANFWSLQFYLQDALYENKQWPSMELITDSPIMLGDTYEKWCDAMNINDIKEFGLYEEKDVTTNGGENFIEYTYNFQTKYGQCEYREYEIIDAVTGENELYCWLVFPYNGHDFNFNIMAVFGESLEINELSISGPRY